MQWWLDLLDAAGAGWLAPGSFRKNLLNADAKLRPYGAMSLHFLELALTGPATGFDTTWCFLPSVFANANIPGEDGLADAQALARLMSEQGMIGVELDTSSFPMPAPSLHFSGSLLLGGSLEAKLIALFGQEQGAMQPQSVSEALRRLGWRSWIFGIMPGRSDMPVRMIGKPPEGTNAQVLLSTLDTIGFEGLTQEAKEQITELVQSDFGSYGAPLVHLDFLPGKGLGQTLGLEFDGIRQGNAHFFPALSKACEWGLADARWQALVRVARMSRKNNERTQQSNTNETQLCSLNTLKFRWRNGQALPAKLYVKVS